MSVSINTNPDGILPITKPNIQETPEKTESDFIRPTQVNTPDEDFVKAEILTASDIEIRKLHALRRAKEYYEEQLTSQADNAIKEASGIISEAAGLDSPAVMEFNRAGAAQAAVKDAEMSNVAGDSVENDDAYKKGAAISGYKTYKKDTPKAWDRGDIDEKR